VEIESRHVTVEPAVARKDGHWGLEVVEQKSLVPTGRIVDMKEVLDFVLKSGLRVLRDSLDPHLGEGKHILSLLSLVYWRMRYLGSFGGLLKRPFPRVHPLVIAECMEFHCLLLLLLQDRCHRRRPLEVGSSRDALLVLGLLVQLGYKGEARSSLEFESALLEIAALMLGR